MSKTDSATQRKGSCNIIICASCLIQANKSLSGENNDEDGRRSSSRSRTLTAKSRETSNVPSSSPKIGELFDCPCANQSCQKIGHFEETSPEVLKQYLVGCFQTFCCSQELVYTTKNKNASKS